MSVQDKRTNEELEGALYSAGWTVGDRARTSQGITINFRKWPATSTYPGMVSHDVHGQDRNDSIRKFLKELESEKAASAPRP